MFVTDEQRCQVFSLPDFQLIRCFVFSREGCENKIKLVSACGKYSPWMQQGNGKAEFYLGDAQNEESQTLDVHCLSEWMPEAFKQGGKAPVCYRAPEKCSGFICCLWHKSSFCTCVYFLVFRGVDVVTVPAAVMLFAVQVVVTRL